MNQEKATSQKSRKTAVKIPIADILSSTYIKRPGWEPSGIITKFGEISRVHVLGVVVSKEDNSIILDDGSANILVRIFEETDYLTQIQLGDIIRVIGRPRDFNEKKYIVSEVLKKTEKPWYELHKHELQNRAATAPSLPVEAEPEEQVIETGPAQKIINSIAILDKGSGVDVQDIINHLQVKDGEPIIQGLIEEGEIFEISPGRVKLLE